MDNFAFLKATVMKTIIVGSKVAKKSKFQYSPQSAVIDRCILFAKKKPFDPQFISCHDPNGTSGAEKAQRKAQFSSSVSPWPGWNSVHAGFSFVESKTQFFGRVLSRPTSPVQKSNCLLEIPCLRISAPMAEFSSVVSISTSFPPWEPQNCFASSQVTAFWPNLQKHIFM